MNDKQPVNGIPPHIKSATTWKMANTLAKALAKPYRWQFVDFLGPSGGESAGIVDILAIRKSGSAPGIEGLKKLDLFDILIMQVKGGGAPDPTPEDISRMRLVAQHYVAKKIVLFKWNKSKPKETGYFVLGENDEWIPVSAAHLFGKGSSVPHALTSVSKSAKTKSASPVSKIPSVDRSKAAKKAWATRNKNKAAKADTAKK